MKSSVDNCATGDNDAARKSKQDGSISRQPLFLRWSITCATRHATKLSPEKE